MWCYLDTNCVDCENALLIVRFVTVWADLSTIINLLIFFRTV